MLRPTGDIRREPPVRQLRSLLAHPFGNIQEGYIPPLAERFSAAESVQASKIPIAQ